MLTTAKIGLAAALVLSATLTATLAASAATKARVMQDGQAATAYDVIPGYGKDGGRVAVPNPNR